MWLDIKRGKTSIKELHDDLQDEKTWVHTHLGAGRGGVLPTENNTRRRNRDNSTEDDS